MLYMLGFIRGSSATVFKLVAIRILFKEPHLFSMAKQRQAQIFQILNDQVRAGPVSIRFPGLTRLEPGAGVSRRGHCQIYTYFMQPGFDHNSNTCTTLVILLWFFFWKPSNVLGVPWFWKFPKTPKLSIITKLNNGPIEVHTYMMQYIQDIAPMGPYTGSGQQHLL